MSDTRRRFLQKAGLLAGAFSAGSLFNELHPADFNAINAQKANVPAGELAADEDYWSVIQHAYTVNPSIINLNNGTATTTQGGFIDNIVVQQLLYE